LKRFTDKALDSWSTKPEDKCMKFNSFTIQIVSCLLLLLFIMPINARDLQVEYESRKLLTIRLDIDLAKMMNLASYKVTVFAYEVSDLPGRLTLRQLKEFQHRKRRVGEDWAAFYESDDAYVFVSNPRNKNRWKNVLEAFAGSRKGHHYVGHQSVVQRNFSYKVPKGNYKFWLRVDCVRAIIKHKNDKGNIESLKRVDTGPWWLEHTEYVEDLKNQPLLFTIRSGTGLTPTLTIKKQAN
jgi:hypothetical protein